MQEKNGLNGGDNRGGVRFEVDYSSGTKWREGIRIGKVDKLGPAPGMATDTGHDGAWLVVGVTMARPIKNMYHVMREDPVSTRYGRNTGSMT